MSINSATTKLDVKLLIDGKRRDGGDGRTLNIVDPATEDEIGTVAYATLSDIDDAAWSAERAFQSWQKTTAFERCKLMRAAAALLRERIERIAHVLTLEQGKPLAEAEAEIRGSADFIDWLAEEGRRTYGVVVPSQSPNVHKGSTEHTPLYEAITAGQVAAIELLLRRKASMNSIAAGDQTALHVALECKGRERVRVLIKCGANIEAVNASGALPVHCAAKAGLVDAMDMLLEAGADINAPMRDKSQKTPLHEAAFWGQTEMGSFLVEKGVSLKSKSKGDQMTVLHYAALGGQEALAEQLMLQDIDKNARNSDLDTPLHIAVREGSLSITRILVEGGASVKPLNRAMNTSLHIAAEKGNATIVEYLLRHNTDATKRNRAGRSALDLATGNGHKDVVSLLLNGVAPLPEERYTPLMSSVASGTISGVAALIRNGADINASCKGETALHLATSANKVAITELLLKAGARDSPTAGEGKETALHGASADGQTALVKLLLDHGGDVNVRAARSRATPLMKAARNGRLLVMELLQARGAEINARDENGNTALCHAVLGNELASARVLLRLGANLHFCNRDDQKMPIHIAAANGDCTMASFLLTKGASLTAKSGEGLTALDYARKHPGSLTEKVISAFAQKR